MSAPESAHAQTPGPAAAIHAPHGPALWLLAATLITLLVLTWMTVAATWINLGPWNVWVALGIATVKALLVALYFMHLRYERPFNAIVLLAALFFVGLFIGLSLHDTLQYQPNIETYRAQDPLRYAPALYDAVPAPVPTAPAPETATPADPQEATTPAESAASEPNEPQD